MDPREFVDEYMKPLNDKLKKTRKFIWPEISTSIS
jgi:hypothetical protein